MKLSRRIALLGILVMFATLSMGCVSYLWPGGPTPHGVIYTSVKSPAQDLAVATDGNAGGKMGVSKASALFGLIAFGDASIEAAMKDGKITKIHHVDHEVVSILYGSWFQDSTLVYGE